MLALPSFEIVDHPTLTVGRPELADYRPMLLAVANPEQSFNFLDRSHSR
jgi:hypothetical protein